MPAIIPTQPTPSQTVTCTLSGQACTLTLRQTLYGMFVSLFVNDAPIIQTVLALNANVIVRSAYLGFIGDLAIYDLQGNADPDYAGLGSRFQLVYLFPADLPAGLS